LIKKPKRPKAPPRIPEIPSASDLIRAEVSSGVGSGERLNKKLQREFGVPYAFLTEAQWKEIKSKAGFRESARFEINIALRRYWLERLDASIKPEARDQVVEAKSKPLSQLLN
jgi:hypothetical protein